MQVNNKNLKDYIQQLKQKKDLSRQDAADAMAAIMSAEPNDSDKAEFLIALQ